MLRLAQQYRRSFLRTSTGAALESHR